MANNPLNSNEVRFWLRFNSLNNPNWYQIVEPIGFDGAEFVIEQEPKRFARSIRYGAIDKLKFVDNYWSIETLTTPQQYNPLGNVDNHYDSGVYWLLYIYNQFGFEMDVEFKITIGNTDFVIYSLDANDKDLTDRYTYFQCKLIDNSKTMDYKRRMDDKLNAFGTKDIFENTITPIQSFNYLKKAVAVGDASELTTPQALSLNTVLYGLDAYVYQPCLQTNVFGIDNTLSSFEASTYQPDTSDVPLSVQLIQERTIIKAKKRYVNIKVDITGLNYQAFINTGFFANHRLRIAYGNTPISDWTTHDFFSTSATAFTLTNQSYSFTVPFLEIGQKIWLYFSTTSPVGLPSPTPITSMFIGIADTMKINITATGTSLNSVIKAVRYSDLLKQYNKMVWNLPYFAPNFNVGGKHYNQAVFNKEMVSQKTDNLYFTGKELIENTFDEVGCDTEISDQEFFIGEYPDYYTNDEIFVGSVLPSEEFSVDTNDRFACNKSIYNYTNFAQDRDLTGTNLAIHTQSEFKLQNTKVENSFDKKIDFIRDPFEIQNIVDLEIKKPTTSTEQDFKKCVEDMVQLPPASFNIISAVLLLRVNNGVLEVLNRDSEGDSNNFVVNWLTTGMALGQTAEVLNGGSAGIYNITSITNSVLSLTPTFAFTPIPSGDYFIQIKHFYSGVLWQTRVNEGFSYSANLPDGFGNKFYTIKRNLLNYWSKYIATMLLGSKKDIINAFFKSNGIAETQLTTESAPIIENAPITYASLPTPILTQNLINLTVVSEFSEQIALLSTYQTGFPSRLTSPRRKGFGRFLDIKGNVIFGYIQKSAFNISTNQFTVTIEERYEPSLATVTVNGSTITVNDRTYQLSGNLDWFKTENDFIKFFDINNKPISNFYRFDFVNLNGVTYTSIGDLIMALNALI